MLRQSPPPRALIWVTLNFVTLGQMVSEHTQDPRTFGSYVCNVSYFVM